MITVQATAYGNTKSYQINDRESLIFTWGQPITDQDRAEYASGQSARDLGLHSRVSMLDPARRWTNSEGELVVDLMESEINQQRLRDLEDMETSTGLLIRKSRAVQ